MLNEKRYFLIHEYLILLSGFLLGLILFLFVNASASIKKQGSPDNKFQDEFPDIILNKYNNALTYLIVALCLIRFFIIFIASEEIYNFYHYSSRFIYFFVLLYLYLAIWFILFFFFKFRKRIKEERRYDYLSKIYKWGSFLCLLDLATTSILYLMSYHNLLPGLDIKQFDYQIFNQHAISNNLFIIIIIAIVMNFIFYVRFMLKNSMTNLRIYLLSIMVLFLVLGIFFIRVSIFKLGWYNSETIYLKLFTLEYGYFFWIFLLFIVSTIFYNLSAIIILSLNRMIINQKKAKYLVIHLFKLGFITMMMFTGLSIYTGY